MTWLMITHHLSIETAAIIARRRVFPFVMLTRRSLSNVNLNLLDRRQPSSSELRRVFPSMTLSKRRVEEELAMIASRGANIIASFIAARGVA